MKWFMMWFKGLGYVIILIAALIISPFLQVGRLILLAVVWFGKVLTNMMARIVEGKYEEDEWDRAYDYADQDYYARTRTSCGGDDHEKE